MFELKDINSHSDFIYNVRLLKEEINKRYEKCDYITKDIKQISNSMLSIMTMVSKTLDSCSKQKLFAETSISSVYSKNIDFIKDTEEDYTLVDRYGDILSKECIVDINETGIKLKPALSQSVIINNNVKNATAVLNEQFGKNLINIETLTDISSIIDLNDLTYWRQEIFSEKKFTIKTTNDNFPLIDNGAFFEIKINLETIRRANSISIKPNVKYPIQLCYISYTKTDNDYEHKVPISNFDGNFYIDNKGFTFNFDTVICKNFYIGFNQTHYDMEYINIPNVTFEDLKDVDSYKSVPKLITSIKSGYVYEYGIANINIEYNDYSSIGIYETSEISTVSTIDKLYIETEEVTNSATENYLDTEYYITTSVSPSFEEWVSVFPINKDEVKCEKLFNLNDTCIFRFKTYGIKSIKENTRELSINEYVLKYDGDFIYGVSIPNFSPNSIYTVNYIPISESKYIDYSEMTKIPTKNLEVIYGNYSNSYLLKATPYSPTGSNCEVEILDTLKNRIFRQSENKVSNVTGKNEYYFSKTKFQYYIDGNRVFFSQNIDPRYVIKIRYNTLNSKYKLKAILRRNDNKNREITQQINKIKVITENV